MSDCLSKLAQLAHQLPPAEERAARCFLRCGETHQGLTVNLAATRCGVSNATLVRMCKSLGYKGYKEFSLAYSVALATVGDRNIVYDELSPGDDIPTQVARITTQTVDALQNTVQLLDPQVIARAAAVLHHARRVDCYGVGMSALVAQDAQMKFQRLCKDSQASSDPHVQVVLAARLEQGDAALLFSYSGETRDTLETLAAVKRAGATTISITRLGSNPLSRGADISLHVASSESLVRSAAMSSRIAMMHVMDILFTAIAVKGYIQYKPTLDKTHLEGRIKKKQPIQPPGETA